MRTRRSTRFGVLAAAALLLAITAAPPAVPFRSRSVPSNSVALVDAARDAVVAHVRVAYHPTRIAYGAGAFWVLSPEARTVTRVDPRTRDAKRFRIGELPWDVAVGGGSLWIADHRGRYVLRRDLHTGSSRTSVDLRAPAIAVRFGFGSLWVHVADGRVVRLDPRALRVTATVPDVAQSKAGAQTKIAIAEGAVWVASTLENRLSRIDPQRVRVVERRSGAGTGIALTGPGVVWTSDGRAYLWRVGAPRAMRIRVGTFPVDVAAAKNAVWVANAGNSTLTRVDPHRGRVVAQIRLGQYPTAVAAGGRFVAVALFGGGGP
jgi:DNA-binding beta-propeller fold protein YncE